MKELSIVIPCKNEEKYIGKLLNSFIAQTYNMKNVDIIIADANSTDKTVEVVKSFQDKLNIKVIEGGLPSVGRNMGSKHCDSTYILFIDADIELGSKFLIENTIKLAKKKNLDLTTTYMYCPDGSTMTKFLYHSTNTISKLSKYFNKPFVTGMYFFIKTDVFNMLKGFPEDVVFAEDYALSKKISYNKFDMVSGRIIVTDRRFKTTGHLQMIRLFLTTALFPSKTKKNFDYWSKNHD